MPKRMLDSSLNTSPSLARLSPRAQDSFHRFVLVCDDFGCFDANPRVLIGHGWPLRPDVSEADLTAWMAEYEAEGMLERWEEGGRQWGYLTGWFGPHGQRRRAEYDPNGTVDQKKGSKRRATPPSERKANDNRSRGGSAAGNQSSRSIPAPAVPDAVADAHAVARAREGARDGATDAKPAAPPAPESGGGKPTNGRAVAVDPPSPLSLVGSDQRPSQYERLRITVSQRLGIIGGNGQGLPAPSGRGFVASLQGANAALKKLGFDAVADALVAFGETKKAEGDPPHSFGLFTHVMAALARDGPPPTSRPILPAAHKLPRYST